MTLTEQCENNIKSVNSDDKLVQHEDCVASFHMEHVDGTVIDTELAEPEGEWNSIPPISYQCLRCKMKDELQSKTCRQEMVGSVSDDEWQKECKIRHDNSLEDYAKKYHIISFIPIFGKPLFTGCPLDCKQSEYCFPLLSEHKTVDSLLSYLTESTVPPCKNFLNLLVNFAEYNTGKGLQNSIVRSCYRIIQKAIEKQQEKEDIEMITAKVELDCKQNDSAAHSVTGQDTALAEPEVELVTASQGICERCNHEGYLPDGKYCMNCSQIVKFQENQEREELRRERVDKLTAEIKHELHTFESGDVMKKTALQHVYGTVISIEKPVPVVDSNYCKACLADKKTVPICRFCEKPITGEPVMRHNMLTGVTTFFHNDCVERVDELMAEMDKCNRTLEAFDSGAVRYSTGRRYDLISPLVIHIVLDDSLLRDLVLKLLTLKPDDDILDLYSILKDFVEKTDAEILDLYAKALDDGSKKYGDRNWEKGIPESNLVNHAIGHAIKLQAGDTSEDHESHLVWNVMTIIHFRLKGENYET